MKKLTLLFVFALAFSCAGTSAVTRASEHQNLSLEEAQTIVSTLEKKSGGETPAPQPKTLDEAVELLKSDEISSFAVGADFAAKDTSPQGKALDAQIELAWGEAQHIVSDLLDRATFNLHEEYQLLAKRSATKGLDAKEQARFTQLEKALDEMAGVSNALTKLGDEHIATGIKKAKDVIAANPNEYLGYRVAADYYRLTEDWANFDVAVKKLEELNPKSNGLVFARAMEAMQRTQDRSKAVTLLEQALQNDPKFTRARAQLLLAHSNIDSAWSVYEALKAAQPHHQIVAWVGPTLEAEREAITAVAERAAARQNTLELVRPR
ncbi:MAG: hypothetical protein IPJ65_11260 [Archangiaceae bacterium]|nr:hypothetical protein [Archangiaceae bacterium]